MDATQCPIETARQALKQSAAVAATAEKLIADTLAVLAGFKTFAELSAYCYSLGIFVNRYGPNMSGLLVVTDRVHDAACKRAEELALAEMPEALRAMVTEMGFDPKMKRYPNPSTRRSLEEYLDTRSPPMNPELGDKLMKRLIALPFGVEHTDLANAVARFICKGRNTASLDDPLVDDFRKAKNKRSQEAKDEPPAKRAHNAE